MKKASITISYDEEKMSAIRIYLTQKQLSIEDELVTALDALYSKHVPGNVRDFFQLRQDICAAPEKPAKPPVKKKAAPDAPDPERSEGD